MGRWWGNRRRGIRGEGEEETGRSGKREKGNGPPTKHSNISPTSKHSNCSPILKIFFLLSPSHLLPSLQAFLFIILDKLITTSCIEAQTQPYNNYMQLQTRVGEGKGWSPYMGDCYAQSVSCILFLTLLPMQAIPLSLAKLSQIMFILI